MPPHAVSVKPLGFHENTTKTQMSPPNNQSPGFSRIFFDATLGQGIRRGPRFHRCSSPCGVDQANGVMELLVQPLAKQPTHRREIGEGTVSHCGWNKKEDQFSEWIKPNLGIKQSVVSKLSAHTTC